MGLTPGIGHNNGPTMEPGTSWRKHVWTKARADLLPTLPIEVVRLRVKRAQALGLPYRTYASVRAASGRDLIALLFSTNALGMVRPGATLPQDRQAKLEQLRNVQRIALVQRPLALADITAPLDAGYEAPLPWANWSEMRDAVTQALIAQRIPSDAVLTIGATVFERDWSMAGRTAGYLSSERYFAA